jgi:hypothetical protein
MKHHVRSCVAIVFALGYLGISLLLDHRPASWEYVLLMFVVFSSAMQDAMDDVNYKLKKVTGLLETSAIKVAVLSRDIEQQASYLSRDIEQATENLKSHVTFEANLMKTYIAMLKYEVELVAALQRGEDAPEEPKYQTPYPEPKLILPKFVPLEPPKIVPFDAKIMHAEQVREVTAALGDYRWWDMTVITIPLRRLAAYAFPILINRMAK